MSKHHDLVKATRKKLADNAFTAAGKGPTLSFKEVVSMFGLKSGKLKSALRPDLHPDAPVARVALSKKTNHNTYYDRAEILAYVKKNLETLK